LILGNGDVENLDQARQKAIETNAEGVMIGRGAFGKPWFFSGQTPPIGERLRALAEHAALFEQLLGDIKSFSIMKKHFKAYVTGFDGAKELREKLMETKNAGEVRATIEEFLSH
jgi:tRNA-dihydrouridine synthase B